MQNLFLSFDSSSKPLYTLNWLSTFIPLVILSKYWLSPNQLSKSIFMINKILIKEIKTTFSINMESGIYILFNSMFFFIAIMNMSGLLPYVFTSSSHLVMTLFLSIPFWLGIQMASWTFAFNKMACHLVPLSTPTPLIPFLVLIESLSNAIRPVTLAIRLTANMTAGHLLMTLLGSASSINSLLLVQILIMFVMILLLILELAVALIQSYVFMLLSSLYMVESLILYPL